MRVVRAIGSEVNLGEGLKGIVLEVLLKEFGEQYKVVWWDGKTRKVEWVETLEITNVVATTETIGFKD